MLPAGGGTIINVGSANGLVGVSDNGGVMHGALKAAIVGLAENPRSNTRRRASACQRDTRPGVVAGQHMAKTLEDPAIAASVVRRIPIGRWGQPEDIAPLATYLASDESAYVTGAIFVADGGWTAQ